MLTRALFKTLAIKSLTLIALLLLQACTSVQCRDCISLKLPINAEDAANMRNQNNSGLREVNASIKNAQSASWHIYLEGDGNPWRKGLWPNTNPNSRQQLALQLMNIDNNASVYLQRPCYGYVGIPPAPCVPALWTSARYGEAVVAALDQALDKLQQNYGRKPLILIGHSGGGTLAMLLAQRRKDVRGVITLAGNLDPNAWTAHHHYLPLHESLNPSLAPALPATVFRWHFIGTKDVVIPAAINQHAVAQDPLAQLRVYPFGHDDGWKKMWPAILSELAVVLR
ncbi:MAG: alpha/beta fold hydrolase [Marinagarivorans sp.]|nr:alpha/beta fold hydrolase [Marinagarivorans sp.]